MISNGPLVGNISIGARARIQSFQAVAVPFPGDMLWYFRKEKSSDFQNCDNKPIGARRDASGSLTGGKRLRYRVGRAGIAGVADRFGLPSPLPIWKSREGP
jgi:hypothetical protein